MGAAGVAGPGFQLATAPARAAEGDDGNTLYTARDGRIAYRNVQLLKPCGGDDEDRTERPVVPGDADYKEPQIVTDASGNLYVGAIRGLADGGSDAWRSTDGGESWEYIGQPEQVPVVTDATGNGLGGGDIAMATGTPYPGSPGNLYAASLWLGSVYFSASSDRGDSWETINPLSSDIVGVDRQWIAAHGQQTVYMSYHDLYTFGIDVVKSIDGGQTWFPVSPATPPTDPQNYAKAVVDGNQLGNIRVDEDTHTVYQIWVGPENPPTSGFQPNDTVYMSVSENGALTWTVNTVHIDPEGRSLDHIFPVVDIDDAGNVYASWSDNDDIYYSASTDGGHTWSDRVRVNQDHEGATNTSVFPWVAAGEADVANFTWYASTAKDNTVEDATWYVYYAQVRDAVTEPRVTQAQVTDHVVHTGPVCQGGAGCTGGRQLTDVFYMTVDPDGRAHISYTDDSDVGLSYTDDPDTCFTDDFDRRLPNQQSFVANQVGGSLAVERGDTGGRGDPNRSEDRSSD